MLRDRKHITVLGLLLLMVMPLFFSVAVMVKQKILQFQRMERFETEAIQRISVSPEKLLWVKDGKEVIIEGELFDVESYEQQGNKILLTGFYDNKEEKLVKDIKDIYQNNKAESPFNRAVTKFLLVPFYLEPGSSSLLNSWQTITRRFSNYTEPISTGCHAAVSPPPRFA